MAFGLVMSLDVFQQRMNQILEQCPGTVGTADDVGVFGKTEEEHDANLHNLMKVTARAGLVIKSKKCGIKLPSMHLLGMVYDASGAHLYPKKVEDIKVLPAPTPEAELQEFLGHSNLHRMI